MANAVNVGKVVLSWNKFLTISFSGDKKVYWSTSKVASHIRSGHCNGASEEEVQLFKREFVYDSPKTLVHKSAVSKKFKEAFEIEEFNLVRKQKNYERKSARQQDIRSAKKPKIEYADQDGDGDYQELEDCDQLIYEELASGDNEEEIKEESEKLQIMFLDENEDTDSLKEMKAPTPQSSSSTPEMGREEKFIQAVYPQFKGKTKLQLIEDIIDLKRRNDLLQVKAKTYENTINRLLN